MHASIKHELTRRQAIKGGAAAGLALAVPTVASADDDPLVELERQWHEAEARAIEADNAHTAAVQALPADLREAPIIKATERSGYQFPANIDGLENALDDPCRREGLSDDHPIRQAVRAFTAQLRDDMARAREAWEAKRAAHGITGLREAMEAAWDRVVEIERQIMETPATSTQGLAVKLRLANTHLPNSDVDDGWQFGHSIVASVAADAERLTAT